MATSVSSRPNRGCISPRVSSSMAVSSRSSSTRSVCSLRIEVPWQPPFLVASQRVKWLLLHVYDAEPLTCFTPK